MFRIERANFAANLEIITLVNKDKNIKASVIPSLGGMLNGFSLAGFEVVDGIEVNESGVEDYLNTFKSSLLLPYPNRIANGRFEFKGRRHQMFCNEEALGNSLHGFIYNKNFEVVSAETKVNQAELVLDYTYTGDAAGFPYSFKTVLTYRLDVNGKLTCNCEVSNTGKDVCPLGLGWHPYFDMGQKVNKLSLKFDTRTHWEVDDKMIPTMDIVKIDPISGNIGEDEYDGCFTLENPVVELATEKGKKLIMDCGEDFPYLQVYTPPHRNSIAIEPMTCPPDVYNNRVDLIELEPGEKRAFSHSLALE